MRCSRKDSGLLWLKYVRCLSTSATSKIFPVRIRSEKSLNRSFQSFAGEVKSPLRDLKSSSQSQNEIVCRKPTSEAFETITSTKESVDASRNGSNGTDPAPICFV